LKANLGFTRMSVRGKSKVHNEMGFALMAVNLRKYTVINNENGTFSHKNKRKNGCVYLLLINTTVFVYLRLVMSQPLFIFPKSDSPCFYLLFIILSSCSSLLIVQRLL